MNALKIEELSYTENQANEITSVLKDFLINDIGFMSDCINEIECRRRDGFIPYSNNKGGLQAHEFRSQLDFYFQPTSFEKFNEVCENTYNYVTECFLEDAKISLEDYNKGLDQDDNDMLSLREEIEMSFGEYEMACFEVMLKIESTGNLFVGFFLNASDAPYFRGYDDSIEFDVEFNNIEDLKNKLDEITEDEKVQEFIGLIY